MELPYAEPYKIKMVEQIKRTTPVKIANVGFVKQNTIYLTSVAIKFISIYLLTQEQEL